MPDHRKQAYTVLLYLFLIIAGSSSGLAVYFYQLDSMKSALTSPTGGSDSISDIRTALAGINGMINILDFQIPPFQMTSNTTWMTGTSPIKWSSTLQAQPAALTVTGRLSELELARQRLQSMVGQTGSDSNILGVFFYGRGVTYSIVDGVYANAGLEPAHSVEVTFRFYSGTGGQGSLLCRITYSFGDVPAQMLVTLGGLTCGTGTVPAGSVSYQFLWH